jgi:signal transduction histidine kinase
VDGFSFPIWTGPKVRRSLADVMSVVFYWGVLMSKLLSLLRSRVGRSAPPEDAAMKLRNEELQALNRVLEQEIRERRAAEQRDKTNLRRLRAIIDTLPIGAFTLDQDGRILTINQQCCDIWDLGVAAGELEGLPSGDYFARVRKKVTDPAAFDAALPSVLSSGTTSSDNLTLADGRVIERTVLPVKDGGHVFLYRDVTRNMRVNAAKSEFMSLASHQLRTPLTAIRWTFGRLQKSLAGRAGPDEARMLDEGLDAARRMSHTIDTMLAISRIEAGKISPIPSELKVGAFLNEMRVNMRGMYEERRQTFSLDCPSNLLIRTDADILEEIVSNLYSNAIKYTPPGGSISVRAEKAGDGARIEVTDDGYGIPTHQQDRIFSKFFRADNIAAADTSGTGLGLYLVSLLAKILRASISFHSAEGRGTTFTLVVPGMP